VLTVGLISITPELTLLLGGTKYVSARYVAIPMVIDAFLMFVYAVIVQTEYYMNKTMFVMIGTIIAAAIDIGANLIFIPRYGFIAAAYTTLFAYACYLVLHYIISFRLARFYVLPLKWLFAFLAIIITVAAAALVFIDIIWLRLGVCAVVVLPMIVILLKDFFRKDGAMVE